MQFGFMKGKETIGVVFIIKQAQEKFSEKQETLFWFVDLEKYLIEYEREVIRWAMCKLGVDEWLVSAVMSMYMGARTVVRLP